MLWRAKKDWKKKKQNLSLYYSVAQKLLKVFTLLFSQLTSFCLKFRYAGFTKAALINTYLFMVQRRSYLTNLKKNNQFLMPFEVRTRNWQSLNALWKIACSALRKKLWAALVLNFWKVVRLRSLSVRIGNSQFISNSKFHFSFFLCFFMHENYAIMIWKIYIHYIKFLEKCPRYLSEGFRAQNERSVDFWCACARSWTFDRLIISGQKKS